MEEEQEQTTAIVKKQQPGLQKTQGMGLRRLKRQVILAQIIQKFPHATLDQLAEHMRADPWVGGLWPEYSNKMVRVDSAAVFTATEKELERMSLLVLDDQLNIILRVIAGLEEIFEDKDAPNKDRIQAAGVLSGFLDKYIRIFSNYGSTKIDINKKEISVSLDDFLRIKEVYEQGKESNVMLIEGEVG